MKARFTAHLDNEKQTWAIWENGTRLMADNIPTATWAECIVGWMNTLELQPEHTGTLLKLAEVH